MDNQGGWIFLITTYQVAACIIPMICFMVIVVGQIKKMLHKREKEMMSRSRGVNST
jgi:hypothetical protein